MRVVITLNGQDIADAVLEWVRSKGVDVEKVYVDAVPETDERGDTSWIIEARCTANFPDGLSLGDRLAWGIK